MPGAALSRGGPSTGRACTPAVPMMRRRGAAAPCVVARPPSILLARGPGVAGRLRTWAPRAANGIVQLDPALNTRPRISIVEDDLDDADAAWLAGTPAGGAASSGGGNSSSMEDVSGAGDVATPLRPLKINQDLLIVSEKAHAEPPAGVLD